MIYHKQVGFPPHFRRPVGRMQLKVSNYARKKSVKRGITIPSHIDFKGLDVIEVGFDGIRLNHLLVRMTHDDKYDVCIAIVLKNGWALAKTVWLCHNLDHHSTLDSTKYAQV